MTVYLVGFATSIFLFYYADSKKHQGREARISVFLALLIPCLIAGLRDNSIGTDVSWYVEPLFQCAQASDSFLEFYSLEIQLPNWTVVAVSSYEIGFLITSYLAAHVFNNIALQLLLLQVLTIFPIYKGLAAFRDRLPVWLGMAVYLLMYYNQSLNMMRQWIAMAFLFYGFQFLEKAQYRRYFLAMAVGALFHYCAVLGLSILFLYQVLAKENIKNRTLKALLIVLIGVGTMLGLENIALLMKMMGVRYSGYITGNLSLMPRQIYYRIPILVLLCWRWKYLKQHTHYANYILVLIIYDLLMSQLTSVNANSGRIGLFFSEYYMLFFPMICMASGSKNNRQIMKIFTMCYLIVYWLYVYVYGNSSETVPYVSIWD